MDTKLRPEAPEGPCPCSSTTSRGEHAAHDGNRGRGGHVDGRELVFMTELENARPYDDREGAVGLTKRHEAVLDASRRLKRALPKAAKSHNGTAGCNEPWSRRYLATALKNAASGTTSRGSAPRPASSEAAAASVAATTTRKNRQRA